MKTIYDDDFYKDFTMVKNHIEPNSSWAGCMFETYGEELEFVRKQPDNKIWTVITSDNGEMMVTSGFHLVNRLGYLITEKPWKEATEVLDPDIDYDSDEEICYRCGENPIESHEEICSECQEEENAESEMF